MQSQREAKEMVAALADEAAGEPGIPHADVMALFDALDDADRGGSAAHAESILARHAALLARTQGSADAWTVWPNSAPRSWSGLRDLVDATRQLGEPCTSETPISHVICPEISRRR